MGFPFAWSLLHVAVYWPVQHYQRSTGGSTATASFQGAWPVATLHAIKPLGPGMWLLHQLHK